MDWRSARYVWWLGILASLLTCGPRLAAQSQGGDAQTEQALAETQESQKPNTEASTEGGAAAAAGEAEAQRERAAGSTEGAAAAAAQNPFSSISVVFFQQGSNFSIGPLGRSESEVHVLPIIPTRIAERWTLTTMVNLPLSYQPILTSTLGVAGLGDVQPTFFFLPHISSKVTWGMGPAFNLPTATNVLLSTGKFSVGPAMVFLMQPGKWTIGSIVNYLRSAGGWPASRSAVNQVNPSYFINYNLPKGWFLTTGAGLTADWTQPQGSVWKVPFGGGVGRVMKLGSQLVIGSIAYHVNVVHNQYAERWGLFLQFGLLFPRESNR